MDGLRKSMPASRQGEKATVILSIFRRIAWILHPRTDEVRTLHILINIILSMETYRCSQ